MYVIIFGMPKTDCYVRFSTEGESGDQKDEIPAVQNVPSDEKSKYINDTTVVSNSRRHYPTFKLDVNEIL